MSAVDNEEIDDYVEFVPARVRRQQAADVVRRFKRARAGGEIGVEDDVVVGGGGGGGGSASAAEAIVNVESVAGVTSMAPPDRGSVSLLDAVRIAGVAEPTEEEKRRTLEASLLAQVMQVQKNALSSAREHADGVVYTESLKTDWRPFLRQRSMSATEVSALRKKWHILVDGEDIPPPIASFKDMRFPPGVLAGLAAKGIAQPTPIQVQGVPVALSGRDMIGIAFTGSGKTVAFSLPLIMWSMQEEARMPLQRNEGPVGIVLAPSRELAIQHADGLRHFAEHVKLSGGMELRVATCIGGEDLRTQLEPFGRGCHMVVATPGRLKDHLSKRRFTLDICRYVVLDEGDRMLDMGFDEDIKEIFSYFKRQRQTIIYSATMPKKIQDFARESLVRPVIVNVGRAGAANLDVVQEVEYVKAEQKHLYMLQMLEKTAPPVLIFAENKRDVDEVHEYLLLKGVAAVSVHGDKAQEERTAAIKAFRAGTKDVLVATDVAAKGMDFPDIKHVINFDMPKDIETYVHRIGRTGRSGKTGVATTFINKSVDEYLLLDLKHLLMEAKQRVPPALMALDDPAEKLAQSGGAGGGEGCAYCGGLGHRITACPKLERERKNLTGTKKDFLGAGGGDW
jgi:ATP-dependent RNA helicase DDX41